MHIRKDGKNYHLNGGRGDYCLFGGLRDIGLEKLWPPQEKPAEREPGGPPRCGGNAKRIGVRGMVRQKPEIPVGTRFKLSKLGEARNPRLKSMEGTVVGGSQYKSSLRVVLDGRSTPLSLHRDYIELIREDRE